MMENVKSVPSFATNFTMYAMPDVTVKPDGIGKVRVHVDCTGSTYAFGEGQLLVVKSVVFCTPCMKKTAKVIVAAPSFLMVSEGPLVAVNQL
jgi:hypothetical protein